MLSKFGLPPKILETNPMITAVKVVTTVANDAPMMNATASSTRLPRRMKALKPLMGCPLSRRCWDRCRTR